MINSTHHLVGPSLSLVLTTTVTVETVQNPHQPIKYLGDYFIFHMILTLVLNMETNLVQCAAAIVLLSAVLVLQRVALEFDVFKFYCSSAIVACVLCVFVYYFKTVFYIL